MAVLSNIEKLRQECAAGISPVTWDKPTINAALQGVEDVIDGMVFDPESLVTKTVNKGDARVPAIQAELDAATVSTALIPVVEEWVKSNKDQTVRTIDAAAVTNWINSNKAAFASAVSKMPTNQQENVIRSVINKRVKAVI